MKWRLPPRPSSTSQIRGEAIAPSLLRFEHGSVTWTRQDQSSYRSALATSLPRRGLTTTCDTDRCRRVSGRRNDRPNDHRCCPPSSRSDGCSPLGARRTVRRRSSRGPSALGTSWRAHSSTSGEQPSSPRELAAQKSIPHLAGRRRLGSSAQHHVFGRLLRRAGPTPQGPSLDDGSEARIGTDATRAGPHALRTASDRPDAVGPAKISTVVEPTTTCGTNALALELLARWSWLVLWRRPNSNARRMNDPQGPSDLVHMQGGQQPRDCIGQLGGHRAS